MFSYKVIVVFDSPKKKKNVIVVFYRFTFQFNPKKSSLFKTCEFTHAKFKSIIANQ